MQFTCTQEALNRVLGVVNHAVARGAGAIPIVSNIRLTTDAQSNRIRLDATNLNIGITAWIEAVKITNEGEVAVPAKLFTDVIGAMTPGSIEITVNDAHDVKVKGARGPVHVRGVSSQEFPPMPGAESSEQPLLLKAALLREVIREVAVAVDENSGREVFSNILFQIASQQITFAAADGYGKLAYRTLPLPTECALTRDILVPARSLSELAAILPTEGMVEIRLTPSQVIFSMQWMVLSSILSSGSFPNYKKAVPEERQTRVTVKTAELREIVQLTQIFAKSDGDAGRLTITASRGLEPGTLTIGAEAADIGGNCTTLPVAVEGDNQEDVIFPMAHLARVLGVIATPELIFEIGVTKAPVAVIRPAGAHTCVHSISSMGVAH